MATATYPADNALVIYAKPLPLVPSPWGDDAIAFTAIDDLDAHSGEVDPAKDYFVFIRAGASPADTDEIDGAISKAIVDANVEKVLGDNPQVNTNVAELSKQLELLEGQVALLAAIAGIEIGDGSGIRKLEVS